MNKKILWKFVFSCTVLALIGTGCGSADNTGAAVSSSNAMSSIVSTISAKIDGVSGVADYQSKRLTQTKTRLSSKNFAAVAFGAAWTQTDPNFTDPQDNTTQLSPKEWMGVQLKDDAESADGGAVNAFGRMKQAFQIFCAVGVAASGFTTISSEGYVDAGTYTVTFTPALKASMGSICGINTSTIPDNSAMTMTVTNGGSNYDRVLSFDFFDQTYMVKNDATVLRVASAENSTAGYSRTLAEYNKSTNVTRAEYEWVPLDASTTRGTEVYRLYYNQNDDEGMIFGFRGNNQGIGNGTRYLIAGKPNTGDALSLSLRADTAFSNTNSYTACVLSSSGSIDTDGSLCTAGASRLAGADVSTASTALTNFYDAYADLTPSGQANWGTAGLTDADIIPFTDETDLATTAYSP